MSPQSFGSLEDRLDDDNPDEISEGPAKPSKIPGLTADEALQLESYKARFGTARDTIRNIRRYIMLAQILHSSSLPALPDLADQLESVDETFEEIPTLTPPFSPFPPISPDLIAEFEQLKVLFENEPPSTLENYFGLRRKAGERF